MSKELELERNRWKAEAIKWAEATSMAIKGSVNVGQENDRLEREIARLKEALREIAAITNRQYGSDWDEIEEAREIARAALNGEKE